MGLKIKDLSFKVSEAIIEGHIRENRAHGCDDISWSIEVETKRRKYFEDYWKPHVSLECIPLEINHWNELENKKFEWDEALDDDTGLQMTLYVFFHEDIKDGKLMILSRKGKSF